MKDLDKRTYRGHRILEVGPHNFLLAIALVAAAFFVSSLMSFLLAQDNWKVLARETACEEPLHNRCTLLFTVSHPSGKIEKRQFTFRSYTAEDLKIGNVIVKSRWSFKYNVNGRAKLWSHFSNSAVIFFASIVFLLMWLSPTVRSKVNSAI